MSKLELTKKLQQWQWVETVVPVDEAMRVRIDPVEKSAVAELGNIFGSRESNTKIVNYPYILPWPLAFRPPFHPLGDA